MLVAGDVFLHLIFLGTFGTLLSQICGCGAILPHKIRLFCLPHCTYFHYILGQICLNYIPQVTCIAVHFKGS